MPKIVRKQHNVLPTVTGDIEDLSNKDKSSFLQIEYKTAQETLPDYAKYKNEIQSYQVELPRSPDFSDMSSINKLYAITQSFHSRVTTIEVTAIDNHARWKRLVVHMDDYIEDKSSALLISEDIIDLTKIKAEATVRTRLKKYYKLLRRLKTKLVEAESFSKMVTAKKKDLVSVLTTLGKQVKALSLEHSTTQR